MRIREPSWRWRAETDAEFTEGLGFPALTSSCITLKPHHLHHYAIEVFQKGCQW